MATLNQRKFSRATIPVVVEYRIASYEAFLKEYAENLSEGGIFIRTYKPCELGAQIFFQFSLEQGGTLIEGMGKVVHISGGSDAGMGVEFLELPEDSRTLISEIVADRMSRI